MFFQLLLQSYCAGFNHANRNSSSEQVNFLSWSDSLSLRGSILTLCLSLTTRVTRRLWSICCWSSERFPMLHVLGCVQPDNWQYVKFKNASYNVSLFFQALPQIFINRLGVRSPFVQTFFRSILPIPLSGRFSETKILCLQSGYFVLHVRN